MNHIEKRYNLRELFSAAGEVFGKVFFKTAAWYVALVLLPTLLVQNFLAEVPFISLLISFLSLFYAGITLFYTYNVVKGETLSEGQIFAKIWNAVPAVLSVVLIFIAVLVPFTIVMIVVAGILAALSGVTDPSMLADSPVFMGNLTLLMVVIGIAAFFLFIKIYFFMYFTLFNKDTFIKPFTKSWVMTRGSFGKIFLLSLISTVLGWVVFIVQANASAVVNIVFLLILLPLNVYLALVSNTLFFNLLYSKETN